MDGGLLHTWVWDQPKGNCTIKTLVQFYKIGQVHVLPVVDVSASFGLKPHCTALRTCSTSNLWDSTMEWSVNPL